MPSTGCRRRGSGRRVEDMADVLAHNGFALPPIGFGTYKLNGVAGSAAVINAVQAG